jgi:hypothetical protein
MKHGNMNEAWKHETKHEHGNMKHGSMKHETTMKHET